VKICGYERHFRRSSSLSLSVPLPNAPSPHDSHESTVPRRLSGTEQSSLDKGTTYNTKVWWITTRTRNGRRSVVRAALDLHSTLMTRWWQREGHLAIIVPVHQKSHDLHLGMSVRQWSLMPDQPTSTHGNYPGTASNPIRAYRLNGRQCRRKADLDFLTFCVLEETTRTTADNLNEDGAEHQDYRSYHTTNCSAYTKNQASQSVMLHSRSLSPSPASSRY